MRLSHRILVPTAKLLAMLGIEEARVRPEGSPSEGLLAAALDYGARGLFVFPLHQTDVAGRCSCGKRSCESPGKHPRIEERPDAGHIDARADPRLVEGVAGANIGMSCGASGRVVVDVDVKDERGGSETWHEIRSELGASLEATAMTETPSGGFHVHYLADGHRIGSKNDMLGLGIDVKAEGGYVLLPPSRIAGVEYTWVDGCGCAETAPLPVALAERLEFARPSACSWGRSTRPWQARRSLRVTATTPCSVWHARCAARPRTPGD